MSLLLVRPAQYDDECLLSYLIRVSDLNGFSQFCYMLKLGGFTWKNLRAPIHEIRTGEFSLDSICGRLGLSCISPQTATVYKTFHNGITTPYVFARYPKVCPVCIREDGYCKYHWNYLPVIACPKHKIVLVDVSPSTGARLSWYRRSINAFRGGGDLICESDLAERNAVQFSKVFLSLLNGRPMSKRNVPVVLHDLQFRDALTLINFLVHYHYTLCNSSLFTPVGLENRVLAKYYLDVWEIINDWPDAFYAMLSQYIDSPMSVRRKGGVNKHFRDIHERLHKQSANKGIALIKCEFDRYINQYWPEVWANSKVVRIPVVESFRSLISKKEAARMFNCHTSKIEKFIGKGQIDIKIFKGRSFCDVEQVRQVLLAERRNWSLSEFCNELQVGRHQAIILLKSGLFKILQRPSKYDRDWLIDSDFASKFIESLREKAAIDSVAGISMAGIQHQGYDISVVLRSILVGKLQFNVQLDLQNPNSLGQFINLKMEKSV